MDRNCTFYENSKFVTKLVHGPDNIETDDYRITYDITFKHPGVLPEGPHDIDYIAGITFNFNGKVVKPGFRISMIDEATSIAKKYASSVVTMHASWDIQKPLFY